MPQVLLPGSLRQFVSCKNLFVEKEHSLI